MSRILLGVVLLAAAIPASATDLPGSGPLSTECFVVLRVDGTTTALLPTRLECTDGDPGCDQDGDCHNGSCTFRVQACVNQPDLDCVSSALRSLKIAPAKVGIAPPANLAGAACGDLANVVVPLRGRKKNKAGKQVIVLKAKPSSGKATDVDKDTLVCLPAPTGGACPTSTSTTSTTPPTTASLPGATTTTVAVTTTTTQVGATTTTQIGATTTTQVGATTTTQIGATTTTQVGATTTTTSAGGTTTTIPGQTCAAIVVGQPITGTYRLEGATGDKRCTTNAASNRFGACSSDADCGGTMGSCLDLPWVTADGQIMPFPTGVQTTFVVNTAAAFPACEHHTCIPCGDPHAACAGIPGCEVSGNVNGCIPRGTQGCCDHPGFIVPTFFVNILGGLCSRVDQIDCGLGVVNTSNPQTGDNEVTKNGDTSDPGPDCMYGTADDPPHKACTLAGEGNDYAGKVVTTYGNGHPDANGIHYRLTTPELSTTWSDGQSPSGTCADGSKYDDGELLVSQLILKAEPTSAGATGAFVDLNGDGCKRAGSGFAAGALDGPITVGPSPGPLRPQPYDGSTGSVSAAVSEVFSGPNSPIRDIGFVAVTPQKPIARLSSTTGCSCTVVPGCPE